MKIAQVVLAVLVTAGLAAVPFAAEAKTHKKHHAATSSATTTGANMKSSKSKSMSNNPSSQGNTGPGTNQGGSMPKY